MALFWYLTHSPCLFKTCPAYCTLLCFRKEITKFFEVVLVSVHLNCLIPSIVIVRGYRPCNTATTTAYICLVVENGNKNTETKCKKCLFKHFVIRYLVAPRSTSDQGHRGSLTHPMLTKALSSTTRRWVSPKAWPNASVGFELETSQFWV